MIEAAAIKALQDAFAGKVSIEKVYGERGASKQYIVHPLGYTATKVDEQPAHIPPTLALKVRFDELIAFADYLNRYGTESATVVFLQQGKTNLTMSAVLDYHRLATDADYKDLGLRPEETLVPSYRRHLACFSPVQTPEWQLWNEANKQKFEQVQFARFLEDNRPDILRPVAGDLIDVCRNLELHSDVTFKKAVREQDGQVNFQYSNEGKPNGNIQVPEEITLSLAPYRGENLIELPARIRFRLQEGEVVFWYELVRPHKVLEASALAMREQIVTLTGSRFPVYSGFAEG